MRVTTSDGARECDERMVQGSLEHGYNVYGDERMIWLDPKTTKQDRDSLVRKDLFTMFGAGRIIETRSLEFKLIYKLEF
jgi:hypothetical protein